MIKKLLVILTIVGAVYPMTGYALTMDELIAGQLNPASLTMPGVGQVLGTTNSGLSAKSMVVLNQITGEVVLSNNPTMVWEPASLTKLLTALVVLDTAPNFNRVCTVDKVDQAGGAKLAASNGGAYKLKDLFSAMLVGSANNAAHALANMCTGLSTEAFVKKMNEKAKALGATNSSFVDSSGLNELNKTTAEDMAKIANAAFSTQIIRDYTQQKQVVFSSLNRPIKKHTITSTSKPLMEDPSYLLLAGKTGLLNAYNYASSTKNPAGQYLITVVLGSPSQKDSFENTKTVATWGFSQLANKLAASTVK